MLAWLNVWACEFAAMDCAFNAQSSYFTWCDRLFGSDVCWQHARKIEASGKSWIEAVEMASTFASEKAKAEKAGKAQ
jgi:hypothetical protein